MVDILLLLILGYLFYILPFLVKLIVMYAITVISFINPSERKSLKENYIFGWYMRKLHVRYYGGYKCRKGMKIFAFHSHGQLGIGQMHAFVFGKAEGTLKEFVGCTVPYVSRVFFKIPVVKQIVMMLGCRDVSNENLNNHVKKERTKHIALTVGGAREIMYSPKSKSNGVLTIVRRKAFLKLAYRNGISVIPILVDEKEASYNTLFQGTKFQMYMLNLISYPFPSMMYSNMILLPKRNNMTDIFVGREVIPLNRESEEEYITRYYEHLVMLAQKHKLQLKFVDNKF